MKIHCNIAKDLMPLYIDDALSEESKAAVEEHLTPQNAWFRDS